jgi:tetratricopeptide (TPR) repeat protein
MVLIRRILFISLLSSLLLSDLYAMQAAWVGEDLKGFACQGEPENFGPFDYRSMENKRKRLPIVEHYHFTPEVQQLIRGKSGSIVGDLAYTLRAFPNHYKALKALSYYQILRKTGINKQQKAAISPAVECYFQRAIHFVPDDAIVQMLYASYLKQVKQYKLADEYYLKAIETASEKLKPKLRYIYGLFLVKQKKYRKAYEQAKIIYAKKFPNMRLKQKLMTAGAWKE